MGTVSTSTHNSLLCVHKPNHIEVIGLYRGGDLAVKREMQVETALKIGCTHIWLMDGDMIYPPNILIDLFNLIDHGADLASGLTYRGYEPYDPVITDAKGTRLLKPITDFLFGDIIPSKTTGCACLLVRREVFENLEKPWFKVEYSKANPNEVEKGEDVYFTNKATDAGFKLWIHTAYDVDHLREIPINRDIYFLHKLVKQLIGPGTNRRDRIQKLLTKSADRKWMKKFLDPILEEEG